MEYSAKKNLKMLRRVTYKLYCITGDEKMKPSTYELLMRIGKMGGCHQMPKRSFFFNGKQFPVCARCTGVIVGQIIAYSTFFFIPQSADMCIIGCAVMFIDWYIQFIGIRKSTNIRRLITGIIGGYSIAAFFCMIIKYIISFFIKT